MGLESRESAGSRRRPRDLLPGRAVCRGHGQAGVPAGSGPMKQALVAGYKVIVSLDWNLGIGRSWVSIAGTGKGERRQ